MSEKKIQVRCGDRIVLRKPAAPQQRAAFLKRIQKLLNVQPLTTDELNKELGLERYTLVSYLRYMRKEQRLIRQLADGKWEMGEDPALPSVDADDGEGAKQQHVVPARQVGMRRDVLVAALFGPA
jgi:hypothetical protein